MQFSEIIVLPSCGKIVTWLHGASEKFADRKITTIFRFSIFLQFLEVFALPAQDMLHTEICTFDGNAIIP